MDSRTGRPLMGPGGDAVARAGLPRGDEASMRLRFPGEDKPAFSDPCEAARARSSSWGVVHIPQLDGGTLILIPPVYLKDRP